MLEEHNSGWLYVRWFQSIEMCFDAVVAVAIASAIAATAAADADIACMANFDYELFRFTYFSVLLPTTAAIDVFILCWWIYEHNNGEV